jgi:hypothetical protein
MSVATFFKLYAVALPTFLVPPPGTTYPTLAESRLVNGRTPGGRRPGCGKVPVGR